MKLTKLILSVLPVALLIASCGTKPEAAKTSNENKPIPVKVMSLNQNGEATEIELSGQFTTDDEVNLSFKTGGIINKVYVKEGDAIKQGQLLATLNMTEISAQVESYQIAFEKANRDYERVMKLYKDSVYTLEQLQNAKSGLDLARQQLNASQFNKNYSEIQIGRAHV